MKAILFATIIVVSVAVAIGQTGGTATPTEAPTGDIGTAIVGTPDGQVFTLPACQEDEVIIGDGDFVEGHWTRYICGPSFDDLQDSFFELFESGQS